MIRGWMGARISLVCFLCVAVLTMGVRAAPPERELLERSAQALSEGRIEHALSELEAAADRGLVHPDLSFNRGIAYAKRAESPRARPGDLGQAAAAFEEARLLRPDDAAAVRGLEEAQLAVAARNTNGVGSSTQVSVGSPLGLVERALFWMSPSVLFWVAALGSAVATLGLLLRRSDTENVRVAARIAWPIGFCALLPCVALALTRSALFSEARVAVVVAREAAWVDESGRRMSGSGTVLEATVVHVGPIERGLVRHVDLGRERHLRADKLRFVSEGPL